MLADGLPYSDAEGFNAPEQRLIIFWLPPFPGWTGKKLVKWKLTFLSGGEKGYTMEYTGWECEWLIEANQPFLPPSFPLSINCPPGTNVRSNSKVTITIPVAVDYATPFFRPVIIAITGPFPSFLCCLLKKTTMVAPVRPYIDINCPTPQPE